MDIYQTFVGEVRAFQRATFPNSTERSVLAHLAEEVRELLTRPSAEEAADVMLLLLAFADKHGFDLLEAADAKLQINKAREWGYVEDAGYSKHRDPI